MSTDPLGVPEVQDKRTKPAGLLPKNAQNWVIAIIALIMVLVILFSGRTAPKPRPKDPPPLPPAEPSPTRIDEVRRRIDEMTNKNRAKEQQIAELQGTIAKQASAAPAAQPYAPVADISNYGARGYNTPSTAWVDNEDAKRQARRWFASNIALTNRKEDDSAINEFAAAKLYGGANGSASPGSGTPRHPDQVPDSGRNQGQTNESQGSNKALRSHSHRPGEIDYPLFEGNVLETVLVNRLDGYFSGPINCMLTTDVYSADGVHLLIPRGTRALGEVRRVDTFGQQRLAVVFHRLIMPDGYSVLLDQFKGLNQIGETGLTDQVNNHYFQLFGVSLAVGAIAGLAQSNTQYGLQVSGTQAYEQGVATSESQTAMHILDRYLNILPSITIREGHRVKIYLTQDLMLPAYDKHVAGTETEPQHVADVSKTEREE